MSLPSLPTIIHLTQTALSTYTGYYTYLSITKTQTYESATKKAAKYSNVADHHLWKTRKTLGGGALGVLASLVTSISLINSSSSSSLSPIPGTGTSASSSTFQSSTPSSSTSTSPAILSATSFAIAIYLAFSHGHISNYWKGSIKVPLPGMGDNNDAISTTAVMRKCIAVLGASWGIVGAVYLWDALS